MSQSCCTELQSLSSKVQKGSWGNQIVTLFMRTHNKSVSVKETKESAGSGLVCCRVECHCSPTEHHSSLVIGIFPRLPFFLTPNSLRLKSSGFLIILKPYFIIINTFLTSSCWSQSLVRRFHPVRWLFSWIASPLSSVKSSARSSWVTSSILRLKSFRKKIRRLWTPLHRI